MVEQIVNPFTRQPIKVVADPAKAAPGDIVYVPLGYGEIDSYELTVLFQAP